MIFFVSWAERPKVYLIRLVGLMMLVSIGGSSATFAHGTNGYIEEVRALDTNDAGLLNPAGLAYSFDANLFYLITANPNSPTTISMMTPFEEALGSVTVSTSAVDPINIAFDNQGERLFLLDSDTNELIAIETGPNGILDPRPKAITRFQVGALRLQQPEGITVDPDNGVLFILDSGASEIVRVEPDAQGGFDGATALLEGRVSRIDLQSSGLAQGRGLALNPGNKHLYGFKKAEKKIYELNETGQVIATSDMAPFDIVDLQGLVFGWSGDLTDDPAKVNLYVADTGLSPGPLFNYQKYLPLVIKPCLEKNGDRGQEHCQADPPLGRILEFSLTESVTVTTVEAQVAASSDDAEERVDGRISLTSSDLEFAFDSGGDQTVGIRFNGLAIPQGASIVKAYVQFQVDEVNTGSTSLTIWGEDADNAATFTKAGGSISARPKTTAAVAWSPPPWTGVGIGGADQQTPDVAAVIEEIVTRPGWASGNSLVIILSGSGERTAESYDGVSAAAPLLHVEYTVEPVNQKPVVDAGLDQIISLPNRAALDGTVSDDGLPNPPGASTSTWSQVGGTGRVTFTNAFAANTTANFSAVGSYVLRLTADDGQLTAGDEVTITVVANSPVLVGAGDIARCRNAEGEETAKLLDNIPGIVFTLGDNAYPDGTDREFSSCYGSTWGRHKARTRPALGNHDYHTPAASGYFNYFGATAGETDKGYYSYNLGEWHVIVLNSECEEVGGCERDSPQGQWLEADLAATPTICTIAYWHKPRFSSGRHGDRSSVQDFWELLYEAGADVVLGGHDHSYERFAPQDPHGVADPDHGIRQFVVGTGGARLYQFKPSQPNSEVRNNDTHGVLKLTLHPTSYDWEFVPIAGKSFTDSGSAFCSR